MCLCRYIKNPDVVFRPEREDGGVIFHPDTGDTRWLNQTGMAVWELCDGQHDLDAIIDAIKETFNFANSAEADMEADIAEFTKALQTDGFVVVQGSEGVLSCQK